MSNPLIVSPKTCQGVSWFPPVDVSFAAHKALIPLHAGELAKAAATMLLAATPLGRSWQLVGVCSLMPDHNLFVKEGQWLGHYRPQWLSTYPFSLIRMRERGVLIFEQDSGLWEASDSGTPFFNDQALHPKVTEILEVLKASSGPQQATEKALIALQRAGVLIPWPEQLRAAVGVSVPNLYMVDELALSQLADEVFLTLRKAQALPIAYALNLSLPQTHLLSRLARVNPGSFTAPENLDSLFEGDEDVSFNFD